MGEMNVRVGCSGFAVERKRYQEALDFVELGDTRRTLPKPDKFSRMRMSAPPGFRFAMVAPEALSDPEQIEGLAGDPRGYGAMRPTPENIALLERTVAVARRLDAVVRLHTTPDLGAGPDAFDRFHALLDAVDHRGLVFAWESRGVLTAREIIAWAGKLEVVPVVDPFQDDAPAGPVGYIHIHTLMTLTGDLHAEHLEKLVERAGRHAETFVVFDTPHAFRDAVALRRLLAQGPVAPSEGPETDATDEAATEP
ncbi:MAG: DUF72 domain-containing protein [Deltaproteobacteria bacterium]|nr:DUF72 domain-containing protein [Deltaproteobacteria bacterium]